MKLFGRILSVQILLKKKFQSFKKKKTPMKTMKKCKHTEPRDKYILWNNFWKEKKKNYVHT